MTNEERACIIGLLRTERGLLGYVAEQLNRTLAETTALIDGDPECAAVRDFEQAAITEQAAGDRAAAACRRQVSTNPDVGRAFACESAVRRRRRTPSWHACFRRPKGRSGPSEQACKNSERAQALGPPVVPANRLLFRDNPRIIAALEAHDHSVAGFGIMRGGCPCRTRPCTDRRR